MESLNRKKNRIKTENKHTWFSTTRTRASAEPDDFHRSSRVAGKNMHPCRKEERLRARKGEPRGKAAAAALEKGAEGEGRSRKKKKGRGTEGGPPLLSVSFPLPKNWSGFEPVSNRFFGYVSTRGGKRNILSKWQLFSESDENRLFRFKSGLNPVFFRFRQTIPEKNGFKPDSAV